MKIPMYFRVKFDAEKMTFSCDRVENCVEEVIRCKDCIYYHEGKVLENVKFCFRLRGTSGEHVGYNSSPDDFCSHGVKKDGDRVRK